MPRNRMRAMLVMFAFLAGCATQGPFREYSASECNLTPSKKNEFSTIVWETGDGPCAKSWKVRVQGAHPHGLNYVEVDEQGILNDRRALEDAIEYASRAPDPARFESKYIVVFVHGWHHTAQPDDEHVQGFHNALAALTSWNPTVDVRGIFIGWQGESVSLFPFNYLTFWTRKNTSDEVGRGGLLEFLLRLENAAKENTGAGSRLVVVAHSFGASVTFNALAHLYVSRLIDGARSTKKASRFKGYGDLVVLINPAIEAMRYMPFQSALEYYTREQIDGLHLNFEYEDLPRLVILSSEADWATRKAFPAARFFNTLLESHSRISGSASPDNSGAYSEWNMDRSTIGNFEGFHTHWPLRLADRSISNARDDLRLARGETNNCTRLTRRRLQEYLSVVRIEAAPRTGPVFPDSYVRLERKPTPIPNSPYWLMNVDKSLIADHGDIGGKNLICWINQLVDFNE